MKKVMLAWSSGKDSAWLLHTLRQLDDVEVAGLFTTIRADDARVPMHDVRRVLVELQAEAAGLTVDFIRLPQPCPNAAYERAMGVFVQLARQRGVTHFAFGDLLLDDVREYREGALRGSGIRPLFPLFGSDTRVLARTMAESGLRAVVSCVDTRQLDLRFLGREFGQAFLDDLPPGVDPCGENGEFHTFAFAGPMFDRDLEVARGEAREDEGFAVLDLLPGRLRRDQERERL